MDDANIDLDYLLDREFSDKHGVFRLWLAVTISAFFALKDGRDYAKGARDFLFSDNDFFAYVCDHMGYEAEGMRERIRKALERNRRDQPNTRSIDKIIVE